MPKDCFEDLIQFKNSPARRAILLVDDILPSSDGKLIILFIEPASKVAGITVDKVAWAGSSPHCCFFIILVSTRFESDKASADLANFRK